MITSARLPDEPEVPSEERLRGRLFLRYEDVSQQGHLVMEAIPDALNVIWRGLSPEQRASLGAEPGVIPILSRVVVLGGEGPIKVFGAHEAEGLYQLSHTLAGDGSVDRIVLGMWARVTSAIGRTQGPQPSDAGRRVVAGRVFAEHIFTRPLGPPEGRKVRALLVGGRSVVPEARYVHSDPEAILALPEGATALDADLVPDSAPTVIGLDHTDSNQHVNSLVYTRFFIEAALRRFDRLERARPPLVARSFEIAYRKPSFAGERVRVMVRAFSMGEGLGAVAVLGADDDGAGRARPRAIARMIFAH